MPAPFTDSPWRLAATRRKPRISWRTLLPLAIVFRNREVTFFMLRDEPRSVWFWASAALLGVNYLRPSRRMSSSGL